MKHSDGVSAGHGLTDNSDVAAALGRAGTRVTEDAYIRGDGRTVVRMRDVDLARARKATPTAG